MSTLSFGQMLLDGLLLSLAAGVVIVGSLMFNARLWLQDYPAEIRERAAPLSSREKRQQYIVMALMLGAAFVVFVWSFSRLEGANGGNLPFLTAYLNAFVLLQVFNLFDAVVIDFLLLAIMQPRFVEIPGAEGMGHLYRNWGMHLKNYLKGVVFCAILSVIIALLTML